MAPHRLLYSVKAFDDERKFSLSFNSNASTEGSCIQSSACGTQRSRFQTRNAENTLANTSLYSKASSLTSFATLISLSCDSNQLILAPFFPQVFLILLIMILSLNGKTFFRQISMKTLNIQREFDGSDACLYCVQGSSYG